MYQESRRFIAKKAYPDSLITSVGDSSCIAVGLKANAVVGFFILEELPPPQVLKNNIAATGASFVYLMELSLLKLIVNRICNHGLLTVHVMRCVLYRLAIAITTGHY